MPTGESSGDHSVLLRETFPRLAAGGHHRHLRLRHRKLRRSHGPIGFGTWRSNTVAATVQFHLRRSQRWLPTWEHQWRRTIRGSTGLTVWSCKDFDEAICWSNSNALSPLMVWMAVGGLHLTMAACRRRGADGIRHAAVVEPTASQSVSARSVQRVPSLET
jgi:hypothetical protein